MKKLKSEHLHDPYASVRCVGYSFGSVATSAELLSAFLIFHPVYKESLYPQECTLGSRDRATFAGVYKQPNACGFPEPGLWAVWESIRKTLSIPEALELLRTVAIPKWSRGGN